MTSNPAPGPSRIARFLPARRAWWLVAGAVLAGVLLFALVLSGKRDEFEFYRAQGDGGDGVPGQVFDPLPAPLPAGEGTASGMDTEPPPAGETPRIDQHRAPPSQALPQPAPTASGPPEQTASREPRPVSAPSPEYPRSALRAGLSGEVLLRIEVGADGRPDGISVLSSSRHRALDQAAIRAVRRWRFEPAMRDGVAVPGSVQQAIRFEPPPR